MAADAFSDAAEVAAGEAVAVVRAMTPGSAERHYCAKYLAYRLVGSDARPSASGYGLGVDHAAELRERIDEHLPAEATP